MSFPTDSYHEPSEVQATARGTKYLTKPGFVVLSRPQLYFDMLMPFLNGLSGDDRSDPDEYINDRPDDHGMSPEEALAKIAGQICYLSVGPKRTPNAKAQQYLDHILESRHGSVLRHSSVTLLIWGVSRSLTHELVRHSAGVGVSQVSQRYVGPDRLRFVERPEFRADDNLHTLFERRIDRVQREYEEMIGTLRGMWGADEGLPRGTAGKKAVQQCARAVLTNEVEAPLVFTANVEAWRYILEQRGNIGAETEIRGLSQLILKCFKEIMPMLFADYYYDEEGSIQTPWKKV